MEPFFSNRRQVWVRVYSLYCGSPRNVSRQLLITDEQFKSRRTSHFSFFPCSEIAWLLRRFQSSRCQFPDVISLSSCQPTSYVFIRLYLFLYPVKTLVPWLPLRKSSHLKLKMLYHFRCFDSFKTCSWDSATARTDSPRDWFAERTVCRSFWEKEHVAPASLILTRCYPL